MTYLGYQLLPGEEIELMQSGRVSRIDNALRFLTGYHDTSGPYGSPSVGGEGGSNAWNPSPASMAFMEQGDQKMREMARRSGEIYVDVTQPSTSPTVRTGFRDRGTYGSPSVGGEGGSNAWNPSPASRQLIDGGNRKISEFNQARGDSSGSPKPVAKSAPAPKPTTQRATSKPSLYTSSVKKTRNYY
jgi:hypothetical protein